MEHQATDDVPLQASRYARIEQWLGLAPDARRRELLEAYATWLIEEAAAAGGIGPAEAGRLFDRHIADSLTYLRGVPPEAGSIVDVGSGVGLPGIPLGIARPDVRITLLDRSGRRIGLASRAIRILGLPNVTAVQADAATWTDPMDVAVFRASLPIEQATKALDRLIQPGTGLGLIGVSRRADRPALPVPPPPWAYRLTCEGDGVLDSPFWLLTIRSS